MTVVADAKARREKATAPRFDVSSPLVLLAIALLAVCLLLALPLVLPIGSMYWDVYIYYDAANRIFQGQAPILDFFTPVGPLGYYLFAGWLVLFPHGQPALLAHWSLLALTAPLMAAVVWDVDRRSRATALALLLPFLFFALLPFNSLEFYPLPGSDAFGIYNRQICQVLYVLVAAILFVRDRRLLAVILTLAVTATFFLKITGFIAAGIIAAYAFFAGRVPLRVALASIAAFVATLAGLERLTGIVTVYIDDILKLLELNGETLAPRFFYAASSSFGILAPACLLAATLLWKDRAQLLESASNAVKKRSLADAAALFDHRGLWLLVVLFAGILFETQNTGSQPLIFIWPVVLAVLMGAAKLLTRPKLLMLIVILAGAIALPPMIGTAQRAARTYVGAAKSVMLESRNLKTLGHVNMRPMIERRASDMLAFYPKYKSLYEDWVTAGDLPTALFYSELDFQVTYLKAVDRAIDSIKALETDKGIRFDTMASLNFVNPFPWLMERSAPRDIAIGADPFRAVPPPGGKEMTAIADTDLILLPTCPPTVENAKLLELYAPALVKHRRITLDACYDAFVHPKFSIGISG